MGIPKLSVKKPVTVFMIFSALVLLGLISLSKLKVELYQNSARGIISIMTAVRGGMPPKEVEEMVTRPIEEAVGTTSNLQGLYSSSKESESRVTLHFNTGTDMNFAALEVREKFAKVKNNLPDEIQKPVIAKYDQNQSPVYVVSFTSNFYTPEQVRVIIEEELKSKIMRVNGVANVDIYGGRERKVLVEVNKEYCDAFQVSFERIMEVLGANNINVLTGGIQKNGTEYYIRAIGEFETVKDIEKIGVAVTHQGSIIQLKQIAKVVDSFLEPQDYARFNLKDNVSLYIKKESQANTITVTKDIHKVIQEFKNTFEKKGIYTETITDAGSFIRKAIRDVSQSLVIGALLAMLIIFVFLNDIKSTIVISLSIPLSVIITFIAMAMFNISINIMTLSGLALAIGILVDSSIVILENIHARLSNTKLPYKKAIISASEEMWLAIFASTITTVVVFLPIIFIDKEIKAIYQGLAFTVTGSLFASLIVALSVVPTCMASIKDSLGRKLRFSFSLIPIDWMRSVYGKLLILSIRNQLNFFLIVGIIFFLAIVGLKARGFDLPSSMSDNEFAVIIIPPPGANLNTNDEAVRGIEDIIYEMPEVENITTTVRKDEPRLYVTMIKSEKRERTRKQVAEEVKERATEHIKSIHPDFSVIIDEGVSVDASKQIVINIFGPESDELQKLANEAANKIKQLSGVSNVLMTDLRKRPEYSLVIDKGRAALQGLTVDDVAQSLHGQIRGMRPTKYRSEGYEIETITRMQEDDRKTLEDLKKLVITSKKTGGRIRLDQIASFIPNFGPTSIDKQNKFRYVFVKAKVLDGTLDGKVKEADKLMSEIEYPKDYFYKFGGEYPNMVKGRNQLSMAILVTIVLIYMILASLFQSYYQPFIILFSVPLSIVGVWLALKFADFPMSQPVLLGMIMLAGIVVNNAIILVDHANGLAEEGYTRLRAIIMSGQDRLRPILMTTASTVLGFAPMAFGFGESGDLWAPLAITVVGGLSSSTIFTLFLVPNVYLLFDSYISRFSKKFSKNKKTLSSKAPSKRSASW